MTYIENLLHQLSACTTALQDITIVKGIDYNSLYKTSPYSQSLFLLRRRYDWMKSHKVKIPGKLLQEVQAVLRENIDVSIDF